MIRVQLFERCVHVRPRRHAGLFEDEIEIEPAATGIIRRVYGLTNVDPLLRVRLRESERRGVDIDTTRSESITDSGPVRVDQYTASIKKHRFEHVSCAARFWPRYPST
jgi:hypothetical protein